MAMAPMLGLLNARAARAPECPLCLGPPAASAVQPSWFSTGITQLSNTNSEVIQQRMPSLFSLNLATTSPGVPFGTTKALTPLPLSDLSVVANTTMYSAVPPALQKILVPFSTQASPSRVAVVATCDVSEPNCGSVRANAVVRPPEMTGSCHLSTCSGVPIALTTR